MSERPIKLLHVITGLNTGGAETILTRLLQVLSRQPDTLNSVICLSEPGPLAARILELKIPLHSLHMQPGSIRMRDIVNLTRLIKQERPDLLQTWMYHADLVGAISARLAGNTPVIWGIHNASLDPRLIKRSTHLVRKLCAAISAWAPARIISCSQRAVDVHITAGYRADKFVFVPNGFDTQAFAPNPAAPAALRQMLAIPLETRLVGLVARFDPQKDIENFIRAASIVNERLPGTHFLLAGDGMDSHNSNLAGWLASAPDKSRFHLLGRREDIPAILAGLDVLTLSSASEAFPLVLGEAMSSGTPCASTDVGDAAYLLGDTGLIVPPHDPQALAKAITVLLAMPNSDLQTLGARARQRIQANFTLEQMASGYLATYRSLLPR